MEFHVLGSLEVLGPEGPLELKGVKERAVLAYLVAHLGRSVSADEIVEAIWGEQATASVARSLHVRVSRLRRLLDPARTAASASVIARDRLGYRLTVGEDAVDAERFARLVAKARSLEARDALAKVEQALAFVRGEPYGDFQDFDFAQSESRRLQELELQARELRFAALVELGRHAEALPELERFVEENPLREPVARLHMLALYRGGRYADALGSYRRLFERVSELGLEPSEESRRLERQMLQRSSALVPQAPGTTLGARLTTFVGRERDRSVVTDGLGENRLLTLTGPGGVGKTSLAVEAARAVVADYSDGVWFVGLASLREPARVADAVAEELGVRTSDYEGRPSSSLRSLENHLRGREVLLILDNCEHLAAAAGELAASLLSSCPDVSLLVTSREPLGVPGEVVIEVEPLSVPAVDASAEEVARADAVLLFVERARLVRSNLNLDEATLRAIAEICVRLDGLPLALELAAARVRSLSPAEIAQRLADRFSLLDRGSEQVAERQRTLAGVVGWSYQLLSEREQLLFRRLSIFPSSFGLEATEEICSGEGLDSSQVADLLASLVDRSMVVVSDEPSDRFRMLETLREYGRAETGAHNERLGIARRHARWASHIAEAGHARVWSEGLEAGTREFKPRRADFEAAADLAFELRDADLALSLSSALGTLGFLFVGAAGDRARVEAALALPGGALERRLRCLRARAVLLIRDGRPTEAIAVGSSGLRVAEQAEDETELARMQTVIFQARLAAGDLPLEVEELDWVEAYTVRKGESWHEGMLHHYRGLAAFASGNVAEARNCAERALEAFAVSGDLWGIVNASETLGHSLAAVGEYETAMQVYERALAAGVRDLQAEAVPLLYHYGLSRLRAGDWEAAARLFEECARLSEDASAFLRWHSVMGAAHIARERGEREETARLYGEALALVRQAVREGLDNRAVRVAMVVTLRELGHLSERTGNGDNARSYQEESLAWARRIGEPRLLARTLEGLAGALSLGGEASEAARLLGAAEATRDAVHAGLPEGERDELIRVTTRLRDQLGETRFEAERTRGRSERFSQLQERAIPTA